MAKGFAANFVFLSGEADYLNDDGCRRHVLVEAAAECRVVRPYKNFLQRSDRP